MRQTGKNILSGKNILIIDDEKSLRILLRRILENAGCVVDEAESTREGILRIQNKIPDLIVLDLLMPEHDGFSLLKAKSRIKLTQGIPVLILSGHSTREALMKVIALGARHFLKKPLNTSALLKKLKVIFYAEGNYFYTFRQDELPKIHGEVNGQIESLSENHVKISCLVKFGKGQAVVVKSEDYIKDNGAPLTTRADNRLVEINQGLYEQVLAFTGQSQEERTGYRKWRRKFF